MFVLNIIMIIALIGGVAYLLWRYYKVLTKYPDVAFDAPENIDIQALVHGVNEAFINMQKKNLREVNLSRREYEKRKRRKAELNSALQEAAYGNLNAKNIVKTYIRDIIQEPHFGITEANIDTLIPFDRPSKMTGQDKFETLYFVFKKRYGEQGFIHMMEDTGLSQPADEDSVGDIYDVTKQRLDAVYSSIMKEIRLTYSDKIDIISQRVFELFKGFGAADLLFEAPIDEIDAGVSGIPKGGFDLNVRIPASDYSYNAIWVLFHGINIRLSCIGFGSQDEFVRVCNNVYKYDPPFMLSRRDAALVTTMKDGSRVVVVRPPVADSYAFFVRKFNSVSSVLPQDLVHQENAFIPLTLLKWMIKGQRNIAITGSQNTGKTTLLKSLISFVDPTFNIRLQELAFELSLRYAYPHRNIVSLQETDTFSSQEGLNLQKKTNGAVNIIGEVAEAHQASYIIQTSMVASLFAMFTHHGKTARALIEALGNNLLELKLYSNRDDAFLMAAKVVNIDCHLTNIRGDRHIERITEIVPILSQPYPSEKCEGWPAKELLADDTMEFYKRTTDRELFETHDLCRYENGVFVMTSLPSEQMIAEIKSKLTLDEEALFDADLHMLEGCIKKGAA